MTKWTETLKPIVRHNWENGSTWLRARIAYRFDGMEYLTENELHEILETLEHQNFIAQMSDNYSVTRKEMRENNAIAQKAREELKRRDNCKRYYCAVYNIVSEDGMDFYIEAANVYDARAKAIKTAQECGDYPEYISCFDLELVS